MSRNIATVILFILFTIIADAQITKGNFLAGGSLSFSSQKYTGDNNNNTAITIAPSGGYFFIDKAAAGLKISFSNYKNDGDSFRDIIAGPFARYYFLAAEKKTNIFLEGSFMAGSEKYSGFDAESKTQFSLVAGPAFFLNQFIAVETAIGWQSAKYNNDAGRYNKFGLSVGFQVHLNCTKKQAKE